MEIRAGNILSTSFDLFFKNFFVNLTLPALAVIPFHLFIGSGDLNDMNDLLTGPFAFAFFYLMLSGTFVQAMLVHASFQGLRSQSADFVISLKTAASMFFPLMGLAIVNLVMIVAGLVALIIPGVMLVYALFVVVPVMVVEKADIGKSISRSFELTKGHRWALFAVGMAIGIPVQVAQRLAMLVMEGEIQIFLIINALISILSSAIGAVTVAVAYSLLRNEKEGVVLDDLVKVFE